MVDACDVLLPFVLDLSHLSKYIALYPNITEPCYPEMSRRLKVCILSCVFPLMRHQWFKLFLVNFVQCVSSPYSLMDEPFVPEYNPISTAEHHQHLSAYNFDEDGNLDREGHVNLAHLFPYAMLGSRDVEDRVISGKTGWILNI